MSSSDLSSLSPPPSSSDDEPPPQLSKPLKTLKLSKGKLTAAKAKDVAPPSRESTPPRDPTPEHEYVLADNPNIPAIVMFRARFSDAFPKNVPNLGPQDLEHGVVESLPSEPIENLLCALIGLVLNRKKYVERGHHGRALEEALQSHKHQWPRSWKGENPLQGGKTFQTMIPSERLSLLRTLAVWCLSSSEVISAMVKDAYKQSRQEDDRNQPLSVQPWGIDGRKRRYWLIEGQVDTSFRLYLQIPARTKTDHEKWWSLAGTIDELKSVADDLRNEGSQAARRLADRFMSAVPRLEENEEKRKRREYRQARKAAFARPEPGFSLYEGRTRGKRMKYTYSDEDEDDSTSGRRSTRQSEMPNSAEPTVTASGRHIRSRFGRSYGDQETRSRLSAEVDSNSEAAPRLDGRPRRSGRESNRKVIHGSDSDEDMDDRGEGDSAPSGDEWGGDDDDVEGKLDDDEDESMSDATEDSLLGLEPKSLVVTLRFGKPDQPRHNTENGDTRHHQLDQLPDATNDRNHHPPMKLSEPTGALPTASYAVPPNPPGQPSKPLSISSLITPDTTNTHARQPSPETIKVASHSYMPTQTQQQQSPRQPPTQPNGTPNGPTHVHEPHAAAPANHYDQIHSAANFHEAPPIPPDHQLFKHDAGASPPGSIANTGAGPGLSAGPGTSTGMSTGTGPGAGQTFALPQRSPQQTKFYPPSPAQTSNIWQ